MEGMPQNNPEEKILNLPKIEQSLPVKERLDELFENNILSESEDGKKYILQTLSRIAVIANVNGVEIPFYQSSAGIELRPLGATNRSRYGHWESDLMISTRSGSGGLSTSQERKSRYLVAQKVYDLSSSEKQKTLVPLVQDYRVKSFTFDRGHENAQHYTLPVSTYFCNAYSSFEKGGVENANKMIRRYFPKKTDFSLVTQEEINRIVFIINNKPRKILKYETATEVAVRGKVINS
jgi:IS30 family transposase